jgi:hypothetical protein
MNELIIEGPIVIPSPNGRFRVKLEVGDDGSLLATLFERDANDPDKWNTPANLSASKPLLRTWRGSDGKLARIE